jgi:hypothetical protein
MQQDILPGNPVIFKEMGVHDIFEGSAFWVSFIFEEGRDVDVACFYDQDDSIVAHRGWMSVWFLGNKNRWG